MHFELVAEDIQKDAHTPNLTPHSLQHAEVSLKSNLVALGRERMEGGHSLLPEQIT